MPIPTGNFQKSDSYAQSVGRGAGGGQELTGKLTGGAMSRSPNCSERALGPRCYATNVDSRDLLREVGRRRLEEPHLAGMVARCSSTASACGHRAATPTRRLAP